MIEAHAGDLNGFKTTKSIVSFPVAKEIPANLVKMLVQASIEEMQSSCD